MSEIFTLQGRTLGPAELGQVVQLVAEHPDWTRYRLSRELARLWAWYSASGQLKDMAARTLLLKLEERGLIRLPARRWASPNRMRHKQVPKLDSVFNQEPIHGPLSELLPLDLQEVSTGHPADRALCEGLLHRFHYLSFRSPVGENLQYLVRARSGRPVENHRGQISIIDNLARSSELRVHGTPTSDCPPRRPLPGLEPRQRRPADLPCGATCADTQLSTIEI